MYSKGLLLIDKSTWSKGIGSSAYSGVADMRNLDPHYKPGALLCGHQALLESGDGLFDSFPKHAAFDENSGIHYVGDEDGTLYRRTTGGTWSKYNNGASNWSQSNKCNGMLVWKGYILFAETMKLHAFDIDSFWYNDWQTFEEGTRDGLALPHTMFVDSEDVVYITDGRWIASLAEVNGQTFDANNAATYTWNNTALDLPDNYVATSLSSLGTYLVIGTRYGVATNRGNRADIFPWNRTAASFNNPLRAKGNGIWQAVTHNNEVYALVDRKTGKLYGSNLTTYDVLREVRNLSGESRCYPDAIEVFDNEILTGIGSTTPSVTGCGIYGFKNGIYHLKNTLSGGDTRLEIGSITDVGDEKIVATWTDGTTHGADLISTFRSTDYTSRLETEVFIVGTPLNIKQFNNLDMYLGKDLIAGQGIRVSYRKNTGDTWTLMGTYDFTNYGGVSNISASPNISPLTTIQLLIEMTTPEESTTSPEFIGLTLS